MHNEVTFFNPLLVIVILALLIPIVVEKLSFLRVPVVVGEIVAGIIIGKSGLNIISPGEILEFLSTFGFTYLMFLSGLEIDFDNITQGTLKSKKFLRGNPALLGTLVFTATLLTALGCSFLLNKFGLDVNIILMALILSTTSLGVVVPILKETALASSRLGQNILFSSLIADFVTMLLITMFVTFVTHGPSHEILLVMLIFVAFFIIYKAINFLLHKQILEGIGEDTSQIQIRGAFALILIFIVLSYQLGVEIILGAFLAGALVSMITRRGSVFHDKLEAIGYGFFVPVFFIMVGVEFDLPAIFRGDISLPVIGLMIASAYLVKLIPSMLFRLAHSWKESFSAGILLSSRLSLIIAASSIGLKIGAIDSATNSAIILISLITCTISPIAFKKYYAYKGDAKRKFLILGSSEEAFLLANKLHDGGYDVKIVEEKKRRPDQVLRKEINWIEVDWDDSQALNKIRPEEAQTVVVAFSSEDLNERITSQLVHQYNLSNIISLISSPAKATRLKDKGVKIFSPRLAPFLLLKNLVIYPELFDLFLEDDNLYVKEVYLQNTDYNQIMLQDIYFPGNCFVISVVRGGERMFPYEERELRLHDKITLIGDKNTVEEAALLFASEAS